MKRPVLLFTLSLFALVLLCSSVYAGTGENFSIPIDSTVAHKRSLLRDSLRNIPYTKGYSWISATASSYHSFAGEDYREVSGGLAYQRMLNDRISIGGHIKYGENSIAIGPTITYTYAYPKLAKKFVMFLSAAPSYLATLESKNFLKPLDKQYFHLPLEFGFGFRLYNHFELIVTRNWAVTAAGFDAGSTLEFRYGIMP